MGWAIASLCISLAATFARSYEVNGVVYYENEPHFRSGARAILLARHDTAYADDLGAFHFREPIGLAKPPSEGGAEGFQARMRAGVLEYFSPDRSQAILEWFGPDGRLQASWRNKPAARGPQRVELDPVPGQGSGLGWLRIRSAGRMERLRIVRIGPGRGMVEAGAARISATTGAAKRAANTADTTGEIVDTMLVEHERYYPVKLNVYQAGPPGGYLAYMWKNSAWGMDLAEMEAWKEALTRPNVTITVSPHRILLPLGLIAGYVLTSDGKIHGDWEADRCNPSATPVKAVLDYARGGREYRDTLDLEALRRFSSSFRAEETAQNGPSRFRMTWDWSLAPSVMPELNWMSLMLRSDTYQDVDVSYPDVFQRGAQVQSGIEHGRMLYGRFDPRSGVAFMEGLPGVTPGFEAAFLLARREDHDLRVNLSGTWPVDPIPEGSAPGGVCP